MGVRELFKKIISLEAFKLLQDLYDEICWCLDEDPSNPHIKLYIMPLDIDDVDNDGLRWIEIRFNSSCDHCVGIFNVDHGVEEQMEIEPPVVKELTHKTVELEFKDHSILILEKWERWKVITPDSWMVIDDYFEYMLFVSPEKVDGYHRVIVTTDYRLRLYNGGQYTVLDYDYHGDLIREIKVDADDKIIQAKINFRDDFDIDNIVW